MESIGIDALHNPVDFFLGVFDLDRTDQTIFLMSLYATKKGVSFNPTTRDEMKVIFNNKHSYGFQDGTILSRFSVDSRGIQR